MLGRRDPQQSLFAASSLLGEKDQKRLGLYRQLAERGHEIFRDEDFAGAYCPDNGRPSVPPSILALATLLQYKEGISDQSVVERTRYDLRWKVALGLDLSTEAAFAKSTFQAFRARLTLHEAEGQVFEKSVELAREAGLLPKRLRLAVDSSPVRGRGAVRDTFNLLSDAIRAIVQEVARERDEQPAEVARESTLERHVSAPSVKGSEDLEWTDPEQVSAFLGRLLEDCRRALALSEETGCASEEAELLERIIAQDVEEDEDDEEQGPSIKQGVPKDRLVSVTDPDMRCQHKSKSQKTVGHKAHVATDIASGIVTAVEVTAPNEPEGAMLAPLVMGTRQQTEAEVDEVLGDCAYSSRRASAEAADSDIPLRTRMPRAPRDRFAPGDFTVSEDGLQATCPAGHASHKVHRAKGGFVHKWSPTVCRTCPLRTRCTRAEARSLQVAPDFHERRARERWARSAEGRAVLRDRITVEHAIGRLKRRGAGRARYFGRTKTRFQWLWAAALANLSLVLGAEAAATA